jgi:hypothetical protein
LVTGFVCAVYAICGGVVWSAYEEFGNQSLLDLAHVVLADRTPFKVLPAENTRGRTALPGRVGSDRVSATAAAPAEHPAVPIRQAAAPLSPSLDGGQGKADTLDLVERPAMARHDPEPAPAVGTLDAEQSVAAALEMQSLGLGAAAPLESATPAASDQVPLAQPAATLPPAPAFKPLDAVPTVVAQAVLPAWVGTNTGAQRLGDSPPVPSLKPIFISSERQPGRTSEQHTRRVTATEPTLPDALRALWTNLKILLASGPAPRVIPAGGGNGERRDGFANAGGGDGGTSVASRGSNGGGSSARGSNPPGDRDSGNTAGGRSSSANSGGGSGKDSGKGSGGSANGGVSVGGSVSAGGVNVGGGVSVGGGGRSGGDQAGNGGRSGNGRGGENGRSGRGNDGDGDRGRGDSDRGGGDRDGGRGDGDGGRGDSDGGRGDGDGGRGDGGRGDGGRGDGDDDGDDD